MAPSPDLLDPAFWGDLDGMHQTFTELRAAGPVHRDEKNGLWAVLKVTPLLDVERRSGVFCSGQGYRSWNAPEETNMIAQDDPAHMAQRRLVLNRFTPSGVAKLEPLLRQITDELVDAATEAGTFDVVDAIAAPLPSKLTAHLLGFPPETAADIRTWSERLMRYDTARSDPEVAMGTISAISEFNAILQPLAEERKGCPMDDLVSVWAQADYDPARLVHETGLFISGGAETTRTVISRGLRVLADHPDQWEAVAADPSLVPGLVEELLRWVTPLNNFFRTVVTDDEIAGTPVAADDRVCLVYPSANRDETAFEDPFRFDVRRSPNHHVAFGNGTHFCLGATLARLELRVLFEALTARWKDLTVTTEPEIEDNIFASAVRRFGLSVRSR